MTEQELPDTTDKIIHAEVTCGFCGNKWRELMHADIADLPWTGCSGAAPINATRSALLGLHSFLLFRRPFPRARNGRATK